MGGADITQGNALDQSIDRYGIGPFQYVLMCIIGMSIVADGAEMLVLSLVNQALTKEWGITATQRGLLGSSIFVGFLIGSISMGTLADKYGRRMTFLASLAGIFIFGVASAFAPHFEGLLALRACVGYFIGGAIPIGSTYFAEFTPTATRGALVILANLFFTLGEILAAVVAWVFMPDLEGSDWRGLLALCAFPALIAFIWGVVWLPESPHFLLVSGDVDEVQALVARIATTNGFPKPAQEELNEIVKDSDHEADRGERGALTDLFARKLWHTTILLWMLWFSQSFVFYGLIYVLPLIFGSEADANPFADILYSAIAEVPGIVLCAAIIDRPWCGRRRMLWGCMLGVTVCTGAGALMNPDHAFFNLAAYGAKFFISTSFAAIYPATMEIYPTSCRSTGLGYGSAASRVGGILTPMSAEWLFSTSRTGPFVAYFWVSLVAMMSACSLPIETAGKPLVETPEEVVLDEDSLCCGLVPLGDEDDGGDATPRGPKPAGQTEDAENDRQPLL